MSPLPTILFDGRSDEIGLPPSLGEDKAAGRADPTVVADWCLYRYLGAGGLRTFANAARRMAVQQRQIRFLWVFGILAVAWLVCRYV